MAATMIAYTLPSELIAQEPAVDRTAARLLLLDRATRTWQHRVVGQLPELLRPGDCLVLNDTRVIPARLIGRRPTGGRTELLLLRAGPSEQTYWCLSRPARALRPGVRVMFDHGSLVGEIAACGEEGERLVRFEADGDLAERFEAVGQVPLPPYIRRAPRPDDRARYQTVFARRPGAVAAPTAGLHFTEALLEACRQRGATVACVTLHVGPGTFQPLTAAELAAGRLHAEWFELSPETAAAVNAAKLRGGRVIAVGTTTCRVLETCAREAGGRREVAPQSGWTDLFIQPGSSFRIVDALMTNFHLPGTSLLLLVAAFAGRELTLQAYEAAIAERYRFYSYGDAMLIL